MGFFGQLRSLISGSSGRAGGMNAQCFCHSAPCSIQRVSKPISRLDSGAAPEYAGGIRRAVSLEVTRRMSSLAAGLPGTMAECPPRSPLALGFHVQPQLAQALTLVRAVAGVAAFRENRADVAVELDRRFGRGQSATRRQQVEQTTPHPFTQHLALILSQSDYARGIAPCGRPAPKPFYQVPDEVNSTCVLLSRPYVSIYLASGSSGSGTAPACAAADRG